MMFLSTLVDEVSSSNLHSSKIKEKIINSNISCINQFKIVYAVVRHKEKKNYNNQIYFDNLFVYFFSTFDYWRQDGSDIVNVDGAAQNESERRGLGVVLRRWGWFKSSDEIQRIGWFCLSKEKHSRLSTSIYGLG